MKLAFKRRFGLGYHFKEVEIMLNFSVLEAVARDFKVDFWQLSEVMKGQEREYDMTLSMLYNGYLAACKERYKKPKYTLHHAVVWRENMSVTALKEFNQMIIELCGQLKGATVKKKVKEKKRS